LVEHLVKEDMRYGDFLGAQTGQTSQQSDRNAEKKPVALFETPPA
jgi:hypothetical protein